MKVKPTKSRGKVVMETTEKDKSLLSQAAAASLQVKHILVPMDFSECSRKALRYAVPFARQFGASITVLHVVSITYAGGGDFAAVDFVSIEKQMAESATKQLKELLDAEIPGEVQADALVRVGHAASCITDTARQRNTDLIIISTHGYTGLKHILLGSTTENVVRHAPCPVLTVREHEHEFVAT